MYFRGHKIADESLLLPSNNQSILSDKSVIKIKLNPTINNSPHEGIQCPQGAGAIWRK